jgi:hypothetical protein
MSHKNQKVQKILENKEHQRQIAKENKQKIQDQRMEMIRDQRMKMMQDETNKQKAKEQQSEIHDESKPKSKKTQKYENRVMDPDCLSAYTMAPSENK